jgi:hypothetical protein
VAGEDLNIGKGVGLIYEERLPNKAMNSDRIKPRCAPLYAAGYGGR